MHRVDRTPVPQRASSRLLLYGEHIPVTLVPYDRTPRDLIEGTLAGVDEYGLLIDQGSSGSVFIPWSSVYKALKAAAQQP